MKIYFLSAAAIISCLFFTGCSSDNNNEWTPALTPEEVVELPYSELAPADQKVKLEKEASDFLDMASELKSLTMIDAMDNLNRLISDEDPEYFEDEDISSVGDLFKYTDVYGIHEWNKTTQEWDKTASSSELKFIFPATASGRINNATLTISGTESDVVVGEAGIALPSSAVGILTVDEKESARISLAANFQEDNMIPSAANLNISFGNYSVEFNFNKAAENKLTSTWKHNNDLMLYAGIGATINLDDLLIGDKNLSYGKANSFIQIMDNLVFYADIDINTLKQEMDAIEDKFRDKEDELTFESDKDYFDKISVINHDCSKEEVACMNKNMTYILASAKDHTKIATLKFVSEEYTFNPGWEWSDSESTWIITDYPNSNVVVKGYDTEIYLVFNDNTEVEAKVYFSEGFDEFLEKWNQFIKDFK